MLQQDGRKSISKIYKNHSGSQRCKKHGNEEKWEQKEDLENMAGNTFRKHS